MSVLVFITLVVLFCLDIIPNILSRDKTLIWQPTTFLVVYLKNTLNENRIFFQLHQSSSKISS